MKETTGRRQRRSGRSRWRPRTRDHRARSPHQRRDLPMVDASGGVRPPRGLRTAATSASWNTAVRCTLRRRGGLGVMAASFASSSAMAVRCLWAVGHVPGLRRWGGHCAPATASVGSLGARSAAGCTRITCVIGLVAGAPTSRTWSRFAASTTTSSMKAATPSSADRGEASSSGAPTAGSFAPCRRDRVTIAASSAAGIAMRVSRSTRTPAVPA
jgi:hypothetical protein